MRLINDNRRLPAIVILVLTALALTPSIFAQARPDPEKIQQEQLVVKLGSGDEEQRMDAAARIGALYAEIPGVMSDAAMAALSQSVQQDKSPVVRALAARALELSVDPRVATTLLSGLSKERQVAVRKAIIYALRPYPSSPAATTLITLLKDKNQEIRAASALVLADFNDPAAEKTLIEFLQKRGKDEDAFARAQAARGLGRFPSQETIEVLLRALRRDKSQEVRRQAARSLGSVAAKQDVKVIEALQSAALSEDPYLSLAADAALKQIHSRI